MAKKIFNIDVVFIVVTVLIIVPRFFLGHYENKLKDELIVPLDSGWSVKNSKNQLILENTNLPKDLKLIKENTEQQLWVFERRLTKLDLTKVDRPAIVLGRMGDSDEAYLNNCKIGSTGLSSDNSQQGWWWSALRVYEIPEVCINTIAETNSLLVKVYKWGGPSYGIYGPPLGIGNGEKTFRYKALIDGFRYGTLIIFGMMMMLNSAYYLFTYILIPARKYYGIFSLTMFGIGVFEIMTSTLPFRFAQNGSVLMKILFSSAVITSNLIYLFLQNKFNFFSKKMLNVSFVVGGVFLLVGLIQSTLKNVYSIYETWHAFFLITLVSAFYQITKYYIANRSSDFWRYYYGFFVFFVCCVHDVVSTFSGSSNPYLITYGFMLLSSAVALTLAKESADAFLHVEVQVGERTKDLANALDQLRSLEKMKERFFANISHDFKTPIAVALGAIEEMKSKKVDLTPRDFVPAERSLSQLMKMVGDILDVVKAESGTMKVTWQKAKPAELLAEWSQAYQLLCQKKKLTLELDTKGCEYLVVPMDVSKMHRIIENIVSNAIKFTDATSGRGNKIKITLRTSDARMYIDVSDSGIGIPEAERSKVFDRYYQSSNTSLKDYGGSGIGLSFVKEVIDVMNGGVEVTESEFGGSKFTISLPLSQDVEITGEYWSASAKASQETLRGSLDVAYPNEFVKKEDSNKPRVLFAEDNPEVAQVIYAALVDDYNVHFAPNGYRALERLRGEKFDCVVSDIVMPIMRGDELVPKIRLEAMEKDVPVIMLSSHGDEETITQLLSKGANDYVTKPFRREILKARVHAQIMAHKTSKWISQNEKVIELGFLAGGMAHQIRNGLHNLKNQVHYQEKLAESLLGEATHLPKEQAEKLQKNLQRSKEAAKRALDRIEHLTDSVRTYSTGSKQLSEIKIMDSVSLALSLHEELLRKNAILVETKHLENLKLMGYASFHEVFVNILGNAMEACPTNGTGKITIAGKEIGDQLEIVIEDNGYGIEPALLPNLCAPFFTTKPPDSGTGLGLYVVRDVIEGQHHGSLSIFSEGKGKGARFTIRVPKVAPKMVTDSEVKIHGVAVS